MLSSVVALSLDHVEAAGDESQASLWWVATVYKYRQSPDRKGGGHNNTG